MKKNKKQENCSKLLTIFSMSIAMLTGVFALGIGLIKDTYKSARAVSYDDENFSILLSVDELNNYIFNNFNNALYEYYSDEVSISTIITILSYDDVDYLFDSFNEYSNNKMYFKYDNNDEGVSIYFNEHSNNKFTFSDGVIYAPLEIGIDTENHYNSIKQAIEQDIAANQPVDDNMQGALQQFVQILVNGIGDLAKGVAEGISTMAKSLFLQVVNGEVVGLSIFGGIVAIFSGLALAVGITTKVYTWITNLGN